MVRAPLPESEIVKRLAALPGWQWVEGKLRRKLVFPSFRDAITFINGAADVSEELNHHPNWSNVYTRVVIELWTHDAGGITETDFAWARAVAPLCMNAGENL